MDVVCCALIVRSRRPSNVYAAELIVRLGRVRLALDYDLVASSPQLAVDLYVLDLSSLVCVMTSQTQQTGAADERHESIHRPEDGKVTVVVPGVELCPLVGSQCGARNLFTGLLTLGAKASYPLYTRPFSEALVLVEGEASVDVEDRSYCLKPFDAMTVSPRVPRRVVNRSSSRPAILHVSLASSTPDQTWVNGRFVAVEQPTDVTGQAGTERLCRNSTVARLELAPLARFQDLFGVDLGARGICGGCGHFEPGARLPCHRHDFDESITIVQGTATCIVEGRRHELSGNATMLVPEGRCHYFINLTLEPMAMIWVYAGDRPDRIVVDEAYCHPERAKGSRA
jgi:mannose-6-phosphate isomerase-like protein (cupin superfamily)